MTDKQAKKVAQPKAKAKPKAATKTKPAPKKVGRPSAYSPEIAERICEKIATTTWSLRRICESDESFPSSETVRRWLYRDEGGFRALYAHAKELQTEVREEEMLDIADDGRNDIYLDPEDGKPKIDADVIQRSKLRVDARKWLMSKLAPKKYGDKVDMTHDVPKDSPLAQLFAQVAGTPFKPKGSD